MKKQNKFCEKNVNAAILLALYIILYKLCKNIFSFKN